MKYPQFAPPKVMETVYYNLRHMSITSQTIIDANAQGLDALADVLHALNVGIIICGSHGCGKGICPTVSNAVAKSS